MVPRLTVPRYSVACLLRRQVVSLFRVIHMQAEMHPQTMTAFHPCLQPELPLLRSRNVLLDETM
jgi:hypothetical protein